MIGNKVVHRLMMTGHDAHYGHGLVNGAKLLNYWGDVATELMVRIDGDISLFLGYKDVKFLAPVNVGDFMEYWGWIEKKGNTSYTLQFEAYKVITFSDDYKLKNGYIAGVMGEPNLLGGADSAALVCDPPVLCGTATGSLYISKDCQRGPQDPAFTY